jgi:hypothetical protein
MRRELHDSKSGLETRMTVLARSSRNLPDIRSTEICGCTKFCLDNEWSAEGTSRRKTVVKMVINSERNFHPENGDAATGFNRGQAMVRTRCTKLEILMQN